MNKDLKNALDSWNKPKYDAAKKKEDAAKLSVFKLGIVGGGLMEDPEPHLDDVKTIRALTLEDAKRKYAKITKLDKSPYWDSEKLQDWGYNIETVQEFYKLKR